MAQSLFKTLKQQAQDTEISVLSPGWTQALLTRMPEVDHRIEMPVGHGRLDINKRMALAATIKTMSFNQALILPGSLKSALIPFFARIPRRTGYLGEWRYGLLNEIFKLDKQALPTTLERYVNLSGQRLGLADCPRPELRIDQDGALGIAQSVGYKPQAPLLVLCPGAEYGAAKRWPVQRYAQLAKSRIQMGWQVWLMGSNKDREICGVIDALTGNACLNLAGKTSLTEAIDLMSLATAVVTNDSGLMHLAAALDRSVVAIYGSSSPLMTPPLAKNIEIIWLQPECGPCFKRDCPLGHLKCLNDIHVSRVEHGLDEVVRRRQSCGY